MWYLQDGLGQRPDVAVVERTLWNFDWYRRHLAQRWPDLAVSAGPDVGDLIESQLGQRPIFTTDPDEDLALRYDLQPVGVLWRVRAIGETGRNYSASWRDHIDNYPIVFYTQTTTRT